MQRLFGGKKEPEVVRSLGEVGESAGKSGAKLEDKIKGAFSSICRISPPSELQHRVCRYGAASDTACSLPTLRCAMCENHRAQRPLWRAVQNQRGAFLPPDQSPDHDCGTRILGWRDERSLCHARARPGRYFFPPLTMGILIWGSGKPRS